MAEAGSKSLVIAGCDLGTTMSQSASAMSAKIARLNAKERIISAEIQLAKAEIQLAELQIEKARVIAARSKSRSAHSPESSLHSSKIYPAKRDVSGWTYQQMRVAINSSTDIILLEACKEEFHRRLKVYNNWKMRNAARTGANQQRATKQLLQEACNSAPVTRAHAAASNSGLVDRVQRYFRLPYSQPGDQSGDLSPVKRGWWCAHFDGDYIARQMELLPDKAPVILVAGKDDMHICGLSVEETGLSRKKDVEILPQEFEQLWLENGGREYLLKAISSGRARSTYATAMMNTQPDPVNGQWL